MAAPIPLQLPMTDTPAAPGPAQLQRIQEYLDARKMMPPIPEGTPTGVQGAVIETGPTEAPEPGGELGDTGVLVGEPNTAQIYYNEIYNGPAGFVSTVNEPSIGANRNVFFISHNWHAAVSDDFGETWSFVNPFNAANADGGFCCDQKVIYDPSRDLMIWLMQTIEDNTDNRYRIAIFRGLSDTAQASFYFYDFFPSTLGNLTGEWFDFPDIQLSKNFLWVTMNRFDTAGPPYSYQGSSVMRLPLDPIRAGAGFGFSFWNGPACGSLRFTQGAGDTMYFLCHTTTANTRVHRWAENSGTIFWADPGLPASWTGPQSCPSSDGNDACGRLDARYTAAFLADDMTTSPPSRQIIGMFTSGPEGAATQNHVWAVRFPAAPPHASPTVQKVFNNSFSWVYPSATSNGRGNAGGTIYEAGTVGSPGGAFPNCDGWLLDEITTTFQPLGSVFRIATSTDGPSMGRWGDYYETRPHFPHDNTFVGTCARLNGGTGGSSLETRAVWFGRARDFPPNVRSGVSDTMLEQPTLLQPTVLESSPANRSLAWRERTEPTAAEEQSRR